MSFLFRYKNEIKKLRGAGQKVQVVIQTKEFCENLIRNENGGTAVSLGLTGLAVYVAVIGENAETSTVRQLCFTPLFLIRFSQNSFVI